MKTPGSMAVGTGEQEAEETVEVLVGVNGRYLEDREDTVQSWGREEQPETRRDLLRYGSRRTQHGSDDGRGNRKPVPVGPTWGPYCRNVDPRPSKESLVPGTHDIG